MAAASRGPIPVPPTTIPTTPTPSLGKRRRLRARVITQGTRSVAALGTVLGARYGGGGGRRGRGRAVGSGVEAFDLIKP